MAVQMAGMVRSMGGKRLTYKTLINDPGLVPFVEEEPFIPRAGGKGKLSPFDVMEIKRLHKEEHVSQTALAKRFGVHRNSIQKALRR